MKTIKIIATFITLSGILFSHLASAEAHAFRDKVYHDISSNSAYSLIMVYTNPIQANQPVYTWRTHTSVWGGTLGHNGDIIGYTNNEGVFVMAVNIPNDPIYCGSFTNERFAVGSSTAPKTAPIDFYIYRGIDFGPRDPRCTPSNVIN